jgi:transcriptional regulator with XRE-family HTH domain
MANTIRIARTLGGRLKDARITKGLTQDEVAARMGIGQTVVQRYETNQVRNPRKDYIEQFAEIYDVSYSHIVDDPYSMDHIPSEIKEMFYDSEALDLLADAFVKYQERKINNMKKALERNER